MRRCARGSFAVVPCIRAAWIVCSIAIASSLSGCSGGILEPEGPVGAANLKILYDSLAIMLGVVVPTIGATAAFAWWFRDSNRRARYRPGWVYSGRIELIVWGIPLLVIMFLGGLIWEGSRDLDPYKPLRTDVAPLEVQVVSLDWKWLFIYPDQGVASVNEVVLPSGVPAHFSLTSASVMNAFFVPQLGSMIATMNGMVTQLHLQADHPGDYYGESTQYSGAGFSDMHFTVHAVRSGEFEKWIAGAKQSNMKLDRENYLALLKPSQNVGPFSYGSVDPGLFKAIVSQQLPPAPGPSIGSEGKPTSQAEN
jgi:cytochrome o ubiquinol oxidase subunit II